MNHFQSAPYNDFSIRREKLRSILKQNNADACILASNTNLFYMTGVVYNGYYYLPAEGEPFHFIKRPNGVELENVVYIRKPEQIIEALQSRGLKVPEKVFLEVDTLPYSECVRLINSLGVQETLNASATLRKIRSIKSAFEIAQVRECARIHQTVYQQIPSVFKRGMTDMQFQIEIERLMRLHGSLGVFHTFGENMNIHMGSILVGENAEEPSPYDFALGGKGADPTLPIGASNIPIQEGQTIMVDMAGNYRPWMTDMTRVFAVGKTSELAYKAHQVSIEICNAVCQAGKPGTACAELYHHSVEIARQHKLEAYFMGTRQQAKFVGHGVGLEINELPILTPRSKEVLEPGVVFALEPKFVIPQIGAVGIENTYVVTDTGIEKLTVCEEEIIEL